MKTVRDVTRDLMRQLGLTTVFGNPGTTEIAFLTDWPDDFRYVLGLQESAVVAMADGYAHAARQPVLVNLHSAGGLGHGLGHVFTAFKNRTPLIVLAGQQMRTLLPDDPFLGAKDAAEFPKPYVKWSCEPARAQDVPAALARAFHVATQAPQGPVFLSVPVDDWDQPFDGPLPVRPRIPGFAPDPETLRTLVEALNGSERPGIVAGPAIDEDGAVGDLVALAEKLNAGVWAAGVSPRCSFPENHPLFRGFISPERKATAEALSEHDVVLVLGAPAFTYHVYRGESEIPLPQLFLVSDDDQELARAREGVGLRSTMKLAITALLAEVEQSDRERPAVLRRPPRPVETSPLSAGFVYSTIAELLPDNAIVVEETPSHRTLLHDHLPITSTDFGFLTTASGALGYGLPAAVGAALARPERKVVAVIGDGSSMYSIQALWTAAREELPVAFVILDNAQYSAVRTLGAAAGGRNIPGVDLGDLDFTALARGMGCAAHTVTQPGELKTALAQAFSDEVPHLVHVVVDQKPPAMY